VGEWLKPSLC